MLGKLMKHEFRATGRIGLPLCGVMLALSLAAGITIRFWDGRENSALWDRTGSIIIMLYGMSIFAVAVGIFVVLMQHYKRNLLGDEGYLMRTLPVSIHELLLSKLFVALIWYIAAAALIFLSFLFVGMFSGSLNLAGLNGADIKELLRVLSEKLDAGFCIQMVLGLLGGMALFTLLFYADFTLSQTFSKHKVLYNIMGVVIFIALLRLIFAFNGAFDDMFLHAAHTAETNASVGIIGGADGPTAIYVTDGHMGGHGYLGLIELYLVNIGLYFLTWAFLKFKPNIE